MLNMNTIFIPLSVIFISLAINTYDVSLYY